MSLKGCFSLVVHRFAHAVSRDVAPWMRHQPSSPPLCSSLLHEVCDVLVGAVRLLQALLVGRSCCWRLAMVVEEACVFCRNCLQNSSEPHAVVAAS